MICCKTVIGFGAPNKEGTASTHGAPLGVDEIAAARDALGWPHAPFEVPDSVAAAWDGREAGAAAESAWRAGFEEYQRKRPELAAEYLRCAEDRLPSDWSTIADAAIRRDRRLRCRHGDAQGFASCAECAGAEFAGNGWWLRRLNGLEPDPSRRISADNRRRRDG